MSSDLTRRARRCGLPWNCRNDTGSTSPDGSRWVLIPDLVGGIEEAGKKPTCNE